MRQELTLAGLEWAMHFRERMLAAGIVPIYWPVERRVQLVASSVNRVPPRYVDELNTDNNARKLALYLYREYRGNP